MVATIGGFQYFEVHRYVCMIALSIHPLYGIGMLVNIFFPVQKEKERTSVVVLACASKCIRGKTSEPEDRLPYISTGAHGRVYPS